MNLVLLGPPGSGKGTQAKLLGEKLKIPHISLGDMLREEVRKESALGKKVKAVMEAGNLVPDEVTIELTRQRLAEKDCRAGFILDGFPRSAAQAEAFDKILKDLKIGMDRLLYFNLTEEQVVRRLSGRRSCKVCGAVYHIELNPPKKKNVCDRCGGDLYQRKDDEESAIRTRFEVYAAQTRPLLKRYENTGKLALIAYAGN